MGLIKAALGAAGGVLADQWKEFFYCDSLDKDTLVVKGQKRTSSALFQDDGWRLSADCLSGDARVTLDDVRITDEDAGTLLAIAFDEELDRKVFTYRALPDDLVVQDEDVHLVSMHFGKTAGQAHIESEALEEGFFALVRKYTGNNLSKEE